jgi:hypothetical protein
MTMLETKNIYWLAGILEGEGTFSVKQSLSGKFTPRITIEMSDSDVIDKVKLLMSPATSIGVRKRGESTYKIMYSFSVYGVIAIEWMMTLYPLMSIRRKAKISEVIGIWKTLGKQKKGRGGVRRDNTLVRKVLGEIRLVS